MRRVFRTASFRLTVIYAAVFCFSVLLLSLWMFFSVRASLEHQLRTHIESETAQLFGDYRDDGLEELRHDIRERVEKKAPSRLLYTVQGPEGRAIFDPIPHLDAPGWHTVRNDQKMRLLVKATPLDDAYMLLVAADLSHNAELEAVLRHRFLIALALTVLLGACGGLWASKRFLTRVDALACTAERIGEGHLSERIRLYGTDDEFDQLGLVINRMLERIELLIANLQHVTTSIAHDLRTPLGRLRQKLETLQDTPTKADALALLDETLATFTALLRIAEIESGSRRAGFATVDVSTLLERLAELYGPLAEEQGYAFIASIAPGVRVQGDAALLTQMVANLVENAMIHGGGSGAIVLALAASGEITVTDRGPGIPAAQYDEVMKPFYRLDESRRQRGNGLGLHLVQAIARLHGGSVVLADHQPGLKVIVRGL